MKFNTYHESAARSEEGGLRENLNERKSSRCGQCRPRSPKQKRIAISIPMPRQPLTTTDAIIL